MHMKIGDFFLGLFEALSRVYDGIMMSLSSFEKGLIKSAKNALYF